ncbi:MAG: hypothetical protein ACXVRN_05270, partial [Solirubrobacteraceae bacterium]
MATVWFWLLSFMIVMYVVLDGFDLGVGALHRVLAQHAQFAVAALEQRLEDVLEVRLHLGERLGEHLARREVDLLDRLEQLRLRLVQILALLREEREALVPAARVRDHHHAHHGQAAQQVDGDHARRAGARLRARPRRRPRPAGPRLRIKTHRLAHCHLRYENDFKYPAKAGCRQVLMHGRQGC